jgi:hypothetical protein
MKPPTQRPLILLAGWLGCHPRQLRRYEALYEKHDFHVVSRIATPSSVFNYVLDRKDTELEQLARDFMASDEMKSCSHYYIHAFSNGGCFLYETIRQLAGDNHQPAGILFDSCPAAELERISDALQYCSWREKTRVLWDFGLLTYLQMSPLFPTSSMQDSLRRRADSFIRSLENDPTIPQLFLYSLNDTLAPSKYVDRLVAVRQKRFGKDVITSKVWDKSSHCAHLRDHPDEYTQAVDSFLIDCERRRQQKAVSKL